MSKEKKANEKIAFYIDVRVSNKLRNEAKLQGRTVSELLKEAVIKLLKSYNVSLDEK